MKKTIIAATLAIATFVSFTSQAQTVATQENATKTEQCQKQGCNKDKKDGKKSKSGKKCQKGKKCDKMSKGAEGCMQKKGGPGKGNPLFNGITLSEKQRADIKTARMEIRKDEQKKMDSKLKKILTPEQYAVYQQNSQKMQAGRAERMNKDQKAMKR